MVPKQKHFQNSNYITVTVVDLARILYLNPDPGPSLDSDLSIFTL